MKSSGQRFTFFVLCGKIDKEVITIIGNNLFDHGRIESIKDKNWLAHSCQIDCLLISHKDDIEVEIWKHKVVSFANRRYWEIEHSSTKVVTSFVIDPYDCVF